MIHDPVARDRLFFALRPPHPLAVRIANAAVWHFPSRGTPIAAERLHVTLFVVPDLRGVPAGLVERLCRIGQTVRAAPFELVLDMLSGSGRSIAARPRRPLPALQALRAAIAVGAQDEAILERPHYEFYAHVTLCYRASTPFSGPVDPIGWTADAHICGRATSADRRIPKGTRTGRVNPWRDGGIRSFRRRR